MNLSEFRCLYLDLINQSQWSFYVPRGKRNRDKRKRTFFLNYPNFKKQVLKYLAFKNIFKSMTQT